MAIASTTPAPVVSADLHTKILDVFEGSWKCKVTAVGIVTIGVRKPIKRIAVKYRQRFEGVLEPTDRLYIFGEPLKKSIKRQTIGFNFDGGEWYVAGWYEIPRGGSANEHHPFGEMTLVFKHAGAGLVSDGDRYRREMYTMTFDAV